ncbi:uncharacterized protein [Lolium perenne]|uniref:uncharacterized protein n=1 Tax=Lolium perenne TaxID=4522 RepID=UPI0021F6958B|nr:receptor like protein kinase S.2-like [Lolium perenne]XP_051179806.1 receptor like protein kinase S.2-like [Lolium perenne]
MDDQVSTTRSDLEHMVQDENAKPRPLQLSVIEGITNGFSDDREIGRGGFAVVYKGELRNGMIAVKKLLNTHIQDEKFQEEVKCLMKVKHNNVVRFLGYCADTQGRLVDFEGNMVMADVRQRLLCFEYLQKGCLHDYITDAYSGLEWTQRYEIIKGICKGLKYLHDNHIVHLDLKPANILLDDNMVPKIADFGLAKCFGEHHSRIIISKLGGTPGYLAPEFYGGKITFKSDIYSLGIIIAEILTGQKGYTKVENILESWSNRLDNSDGETQLEQVRVCAEVGKECTEYNPAMRPDPQSIIKKLDESESTNGPTEDAVSSSSVEQVGLLTANDLEQMLIDEDAEPKNLPLSLLEQITNHFSDDQEIGRGGFAVVYKGVLGNEFVAVKQLSTKLEINENKLYQQVYCLMDAKHPNIIRCLGCCVDTQRKRISYNGKFVTTNIQQRLLCFEYMHKGSLHDYITDASRGLEWRNRYKIIKGICEGLHYLHENHIVHSDLKPHNILMDSDMLPKIADFGLSKCFDENQRWTITTKLIGSVAYLAPEFYSGKITLKSDLYSLGVIIMEILTGEKGYTDVENVRESWKVRFEKSQEDICTQLEQVRVCADVGRECTDYNPKMRPDPRIIIDRLVETETTDGSTETSRMSSSIAQHRLLTAHDLEKILLDATAEPMSLPLSLLEQITNYFSSDQEIGSGGYAVVYKGMIGNQIVAVKMLSNAYMHERIFHQEVECLMKAKHKNIIRFLGYCADTQGKMASYQGRFVMADVSQRLLCFEYLPKSLDRYVIDASHGFEWRVHYQIIKGICHGLNYLHQSHIIHLDLKPANILLDYNLVPKIADFGLSRCFDEKESQIVTSHLMGTMGYMPPEFFSGQITLKIDLYSLGVIIIEMLTGEKGYFDIDCILQMWANRLEISQLEQVRVCAEIGQECIATNPAKRPTTQDILDRFAATDLTDGVTKLRVHQ